MAIKPHDCLPGCYHGSQAVSEAVSPYPVSLVSPFTDRKTTVKTFRITIEELDDTPTDTRVTARTIIKCESRYMLAEDLTEWVKEEIDAHASITTEEDKPDDDDPSHFYTQD